MRRASTTVSCASASIYLRQHGIDHGDEAVEFLFVKTHQTHHGNHERNEPKQEPETCAKELHLFEREEVHHETDDTKHGRKCRGLFDEHALVLVLGFVLTDNAQHRTTNNEQCKHDEQQLFKNRRE